MLKAFKDILATLQRDGVATVDLAAAVADADAELSAAEDAVVAAKAAYDRGLLTVDEAALVKLREAQALALVRVDRAQALRRSLEERLEEARAHDAEAARRAAYDGAKARRAVAVKLLRLEYAKHARAIADIIAVCADAGAAVEAVNKDLPAGVQPLAAPEREVRGVPGLPREILSETDVELWSLERGDGMPVPDELQKKIVAQTNNPRVGYLPVEGNSGTRLAGSAPYVLRKYRKVEFLPPVLGKTEDPLAKTVALPGLGYNARPIWETPSFNAYDHQHVASHAAALVAARDHEARTEAPARKPSVEYVPLVPRAAAGGADVDAAA